MRFETARTWIQRVESKAIANAKKALMPLLAQRLNSCAIVAKDGCTGDLQKVFASHPRIHTAEGCFYRDVLRQASTVPVHIVPPASLDANRVGRLASPPRGRDQKPSALPAWSIIGK
jgi:hypothetical protein